MLVLFQNLNSGYFVKSPNNPTEYIVPAFYAGQNVSVQYHTLNSTYNVAAPFMEVTATNGTLTISSPSSNTYLSFPLTAAGGNSSYMTGNINIASNTNLIPTGNTWVDVIFGSVIHLSGDNIYLDTNATLKTPGKP